MTTATRPRTYRPTVADKAEMLLVNAQAWLRCRDPKTGRRVAYGVPSLSVPGKFHLTDGTRCDCLAGQAGRVCCHALAAAAYIAERRRYPCLDCGRPTPDNGDPFCSACRAVRELFGPADAAAEPFVLNERVA